jgi:hypothetical protein
MIYSFYVTLQVQPAAAIDGEIVELAGEKIRTLGIDPHALAATLYDCSFEVARDRLAQLERMYCEPDGSFVWVSPSDGPAWQVDGNLYDRNERLLFVDLKGTCPSDQFDRLLSAVGWPRTRIMFQLTREAVFLDENEFRRVASLAGRK